MPDNKTVLITGGAKGIGAAAAVAFADKGYNVALNYRSVLPDALIEEIKSKGVRCCAFKADVSDFSEAEALVAAAAAEFGSIDVLVNNAGITKDGLLMRMSEADFDMVIQTNLKGVFNMLRHITKVMLKQKSGSIINMSSIVGIAGNSGQANYAASKAGIIGLTKTTAKELAPRSITCNAIAPGFIETDMTAALADKIKENMLAAIPLKRFGAPEEVAALAVFLAENKYITGQTITIDGGMVMS